MKIYIYFAISEISQAVSIFSFKALTAADNINFLRENAALSSQNIDFYLINDTKVYFKA